MVFRPDFAIRLLAADPKAGFEAPIRIYLYENTDGTATVSYLPPSAVFAPYRNPEVQAIGAELDPIFKATPQDARDLLVADFSIDVTEPGFALGYVFDIVLRGRRATPRES